METTVGSWLRCYRCWSQNLEVQVHYEGIHRIDPVTGKRAEVVDEVQEAVVQCLDCMHDQPHLGFQDGRVQPIEDRWERMIAGTPWVASCTVTVEADTVETCSGPEATDALSFAAFGDFGTREFFTHVRFHKHDDDDIVIHLLVELYARSAEEATEVLEGASRGALTITSLAEESRPPAATGTDPHEIPAVRVAVVGHVEWVTFAQVPRMPAAGEIVHVSRTWDDPGGGGSVAAVQLARLAGEAWFLTALAGDENGRRATARLEELGVVVHAAPRPAPQRRAFTHLDDAGERTITVMGDRIVPVAADPLPWDELADMDAIYLTGGDAGAVHAARRARVLVATPRASEALAEAGVELDALVYSAGDADESRWARESGHARYLVATRGKAGGDFTAADGATGKWQAAVLPGPIADAYGAGDSFAAALAFALGRGDAIEDAVALAAHAGAMCMTGHGPYERQLRAADV